MTRSTGEAAARREPALAAISLALTGACVFLGGLIALLSLATPPWMDEFNTYVTTARAHSLSTFFEYVLRGQHPLGFEGPLWLAQKLGVTDLYALRLYNIVGIAIAIGAIILARRRAIITTTQAAVIAALYLSSSSFLVYFGSLRPYFLMFSASIAVALAWRLVERKGWRNSLWLWCGALAIFVNLHYFATIFGGFLTAALIVQQLARNDRDGAVSIAGVSALAASPALILGLLQSTTTISGGTLYYFTPGLAAGLSTIGMAFSAALAMNIPAGLCALWGAFRALQKRSDGDAVVLFGVALAFFAAMLCAHLFKAMLYERYLIAAAGAIIVPTAVLAAGPHVHRYGAPIICGFAFIVQGYSLFFSPRLAGWDQGAAFAARLANACETSQIYAVPYARVANGPIWTTPLNPTEIEARRFGYRFYAARHGFTVRELAPGASVAAAGACPSIIWIEHFWPDNPARLLYNLAIQNNGPGYYSQVGSGVVIVVKPKPAPQAD